MGIDSIVGERHLLTHPFYRRWQKGKVTSEVLREYAKQYYRYEISLPAFIESALAHVEDPVAREALQRVHDDECSNPKPHSEMWLDFAAGLGLTEQEVTNAEPSAKTANLVETYHSLCAAGAEEGLAALYAYESQVPEIAKEKANGLMAFYGVTGVKPLKFFELHTTLDVEHAKSIRRGLIESDRARQAAHLALDAWWGMLDQFETLAANAA